MELHETLLSTSASPQQAGETLGQERADRTAKSNAWSIEEAEAVIDNTSVDHDVSSPQFTAVSKE